MPYSYCFKCLTLGDVGVGKSCLVLQYTERKFREAHEPTIGGDFGTRIIATLDDAGNNNKLIKLQICDMPGNEPARCLTRSCYLGAIAAILVYDVTNRESFDHLKALLDDATAMQLSGNRDNPLTICLVGTIRAVSYEEGERFAKENGLMFVEASAKTGHNVDEAFAMIARAVRRRVEKYGVGGNKSGGGYLDLGAFYGFVGMPSKGGFGSVGRFLGSCLGSCCFSCGGS
uniref:Uncharacterized protein n=1 Tax=Leersia perrieri TaxID=77586 RepID=A0A0D9XQP8_9ORYZ